MALAPQVLDAVTQELHCNDGHAGVPPVQTPVRRWVMEPAEFVGQATVWVSVSGAHKHESMVVAAKVFLSARKRKVTLVDDDSLHWVAIKLSLVMSPRAFCKFCVRCSTKIPCEREDKAGIRDLHCTAHGRAGPKETDGLYPGVSVCTQKHKPVFVCNVDKLEHFYAF